MFHKFIIILEYQLVLNGSKVFYEKFLYILVFCGCPTFDLERTMFDDEVYDLQLCDLIQNLHRSK